MTHYAATRHQTHTIVLEDKGAASATPSQERGPAAPPLAVNYEDEEPPAQPQVYTCAVCRKPQVRPPAKHGACCLKNKEER